MYPNLFVIGAAKAGTTSLHHYLDQHPSIHMSREKEPNYFSFAQETQRPRHVVDDPSRYQALFETDLPVRGEASVTYTFWPYPVGVPGRIHAVAPDARFIYLVRDPVERALSHYRHRVVLGEETRSLAQVVDEPDESTERYLAASSYATQLEQYLQLFSKDRFLIVDQADLQADPSTTLRRCLEFVGVDASFTSSEWGRRLNETASQRQYSTVAERIRLSRAYRRTIGWLDPELRNALLEPARRLLTRRVDLPEEPDDLARAAWASALAPEAARLRSMTGMPFAHWCV